MSAEFKKYPICDADMWVNMCLTGFCDRVFSKYGKLVFADVVEQEVLAWERSDGRYKKVATDFKDHKASQNILVISHTRDLTEDIRTILESALTDLDFKHGLLNRPQEKNKGEFVSALYADHFEIPFMKTDDSAFKEGGAGNKEFPDLLIKDWYVLVEELAINQSEKLKIRGLLENERKSMKNDFERQKEKKKESAGEKQKLLQLDRLKQKLNRSRL